MVARGLQIKKLGHTPWVQHFRKSLSHIPCIFALLLAIYRPWGIDLFFSFNLLSFPPLWLTLFPGFYPLIYRVIFLLTYRVISFKRDITSKNDYWWSSASQMEHVQEVIGLVLEISRRQWTLLLWNIREYLLWNSIKTSLLCSLPITQP